MDSEIVMLCDVDEIEREINESESVIAKILEYKGHMSTVIKPPLTMSRVFTAAKASSGPMTGASIVLGSALQNMNTRLLALPKF